MQQIVAAVLIKKATFDACDDKNIIFANLEGRKALQRRLSNLQTLAHFCFLFSLNTLFFISLFIIFPSLASFLFGFLQTSFFPLACAPRTPTPMEV